MATKNLLGFPTQTIDKKIIFNIFPRTQNFYIFKKYFSNIRRKFYRRPMSSMSPKVGSGKRKAQSTCDGSPLKEQQDKLESRSPLTGPILTNLLLPFQIKVRQFSGNRQFHPAGGRGKVFLFANS